MSYQADFENKLNVIVKIMLERRLRRDVEIVLLENFLEVLKSHRLANSSRDNIKLLEATEFLDLFDFALIEFDKRIDNTFDHVMQFSTRALGVFGGDSEVFTFLKGRGTVRLLEETCKKNSAKHYPPSLHESLLSVMTDIADHTDGLKWLAHSGLLTATFSSFNASNYDARKAAEIFYIKILDRMSLFRSTEEKSIFDDMMRKIVQSVFDNDFKDLKFRDCCISLLRTSMGQSEDILNIVFQNFDISSAFSGDSEPTTNMIKLLAEASVYRKDNIGMVTSEIVDVFSLKGQELTAMDFLTVFLSWKGNIISSSDLNILIKPFSIIEDSKNTNGCSSSKSMMPTNMNKDHVIQSLICLSKLFELMDAETISFVIKKLCTFSLLCCETKYFVCGAGNKVLNIMLLMFTELMKAVDVISIDISIRSLLFGTLLTLEETLPCGNTAKTSILDLIAKFIAQKSSIKSEYPQELMLEFAGVLTRKISTYDDSILDSSLAIIAEIVNNCEDQTFWQNFLAQNGILTMIYDFAFDDKADGCCRASALQVIVSMFNCPYLHEKLEFDRDTADKKILDELCKLAKNFDIAVSLQSVSTICEWLKNKDLNTMYSVHTDIFQTLLQIIRYSYEPDVKYKILQFWQNISERELLLKDKPIQESIQLLCCAGFMNSVLIATKDDVSGVKCHASETLQKFCKNLAKRGVTKDNFSSEIVSTNLKTMNIDPMESEPHISSYTQEKRDRVIEEILSTPTCVLYCDMLVNSKPCEQMVRPLVYKTGLDNSTNTSPTEFWDILWKHQDVDLQCDDPLAFLKDLIAARVEQDVIYQDFDCY